MILRFDGFGAEKTNSKQGGEVWIEQHLSVMAEAKLAIQDLSIRVSYMLVINHSTSHSRRRKFSRDL
jgi:hypothetical protein